jgi:chemotaxis methyl-accepting protein methylase
MKDGIRWEHHHLATDPPEADFNIICLRNNVLTYWRGEARERAISSIISNILRGGLLIIGCHEKLPFQPASLIPLPECSYVFRKG